MQTNPETHAAQPAIGLIPLARLGRAARSKPLSSRSTPSAAARDPDAEIRSTLLAALARQPWWQADVSNVCVFDGVVIFQGLFQRAQERQAARVVAQGITGVRAIRDDRIRAREWQAMT
jgi:osmotically-inducible protein OsmY